MAGNIRFKFYLDGDDVEARSALLGVDPVVMIEPDIDGDIVISSSRLTKQALALMIEVLSEYMDETYWSED